MNAKEIVKGDSIQTKYGDWYTVALVYDNMVYVYELNNCIHSSNIVKVIHNA
jgi:hypothetical protein